MTHDEAYIELRKFLTFALKRELVSPTPGTSRLIQAVELGMDAIKIELARERWPSQ